MPPLEWETHSLATKLQSASCRSARRALQAPAEEACLGVAAT